MDINKLTEEVIGSAIEVHKLLGPGLLESAYERCLGKELTLRGIKYEQEVSLPVEYKGLKLDCGYRIDMLVDNRLILELKSADKIQNIHKAQILTYMKLAKIEIGLLINFNERLLKNGIERFKITL